MGDMIVPYLALAAGVSDVSLSQTTMHTFTNVKVAERVAGVRFDTLPEIGLPGRLRVKGPCLRREEVSVSSREESSTGDPSRILLVARASGCPGRQACDAALLSG